MYTSVGLILFHRITNSYPICVVALATCLPSAALAARLDARGLGVVVPPARTAKRCFFAVGAIVAVAYFVVDEAAGEVVAADAAVAGSCRASVGADKAPNYSASDRFADCCARRLCNAQSLPANTAAFAHRLLPKPPLD